MVKVSVNGFGTIGKRVADAISKQRDMTLVGVSKTTPDYFSRMAQEFGLYVPRGKEREFEDRGISVEGSIEDMIENSDLVIDCTPEGQGMRNKEELYEKLGVKAIFQGGEKAEVAQVSFVAQCNYEEAIDKDFVRVVSCNTTGLARTLGSLQPLGIKKARVTLIRRAADPKEHRKGPINAIVPDPPRIPSHHGPDVRTVLKDLDIVTMAVKVPTTIMHLHTVMLEMNEEVKRDDIISHLEDAPRIILVSSDMGMKSTASLIEYFRDLGRKRGDIYEIVVFEDSVSVEGREVYYMQAVHQEADVVPENVDAVRAMFDLADKDESIETTDKSLGIWR